jgi:hypothetical protein
MEKYIEHYEKIIITGFNFDGYDFNQRDPSTLHKINFVYKTFLSEYIHKFNNHMPKDVLFAEWLSGLPNVINIPFYYFDILENAKRDGILFATPEAEDDFLNTYYNRIAATFFMLKNNL